MQLFQVIISVISAVAAGIVTVLVTMAVEKFGGVLGGILVTMPSILNVSVVGIALTQSTLQGVTDAMYGSPGGVLLTAVHLLMWRELPRFRLFSRIERTSLRVLSLACATAGMWLCLAAAQFFAIRALRDAGVPVRATGLFFGAVLLVFGLVVALWRYAPAPAARAPVPLWNYVFRCALAMLCVGATVVLSQVSDIAGGLASAFPAVSFTAMVALNMSHGAALPSGSVGPGALNLFGLVVYGIWFGELYPLIFCTFDHLRPSRSVSWSRLRHYAARDAANFLVHSLAESTRRACAARSRRGALACGQRCNRRHRTEDGWSRPGAVDARRCRRCRS